MGTKHSLSPGGKKVGGHVPSVPPPVPTPMFLWTNEHENPMRPLLRLVGCHKMQKVCHADFCDNHKTNGSVGVETRPKCKASL